MSKDSNVVQHIDELVKGLSNDLKEITIRVKDLNLAINKGDDQLNENKLLIDKLMKEKEALEISLAEDKSKEEKQKEDDIDKQINEIAEKFYELVTRFAAMPVDINHEPGTLKDDISKSLEMLAEKNQDTDKAKVKEKAVAKLNAIEEHVLPSIDQEKEALNIEKNKNLQEAANLLVSDITNHINTEINKVNPDINEEAIKQLVESQNALKNPEAELSSKEIFDVKRALQDQNVVISGSFGKQMNEIARQEKLIEFYDDFAKAVVDASKSLETGKSFNDISRQNSVAQKIQEIDNNIQSLGKNADKIQADLRLVEQEKKSYDNELETKQKFLKKVTEIKNLPDDRDRGKGTAWLELDKTKLELKKVQTAFNETKDVLKSITNSNFELQQQIVDLQNKNLDRGKNQELVQKIDPLKQQEIVKLQGENDDLKKALVDAKQQRETSELEKVKINEAFANQKEALDSAISKLAELKDSQENQAIKPSLTDVMQPEIAKFGEIQKAQESKIEQLQKTLGAKEQEFVNLKKQADLSKKQLTQLAEIVINNDKKIKNSESEISLLRQNNEKLVKELKDKDTFLGDKRVQDKKLTIAEKTTQQAINKQKELEDLLNKEKDKNANNLSEANKEFNKKVSDLTSKTQNLEKQNNELLNQMKIADEKAIKLQELQKALSEKDKKIQELTKNQDQLAKGVIGKDNKNKESETQILSLKEKATKLEQENNLWKTNTDLAAKRLDIEQKAAQVREQGLISELAVLKEQGRKQQQESEEKARNLEARVKEAEQKLLDAENKSLGLTKQLEAKAKGESEELANLREKLKQEQIATKLANENIKEQKNSFTQELSKKDGSLNSLAGQNQSIQKELEELKGTKEQLLQKLLKSDNDLVNQTNSRLQERNKVRDLEAKQQFSDKALQDANKAHEKELEKLQNELKLVKENFTKENTSLKDDVQKQKLESEKQLEAVSAQISGTSNAQNETQETLIHSLQKVNQELQQAKSALDQEKQNYLTNISQKDKNIAELKKQVSDAEAKTQEAVKNANELVNEQVIKIAPQDTKKLEELQKINEQLTKENQQLKQNNSRNVKQQVEINTLKQQLAQKDNLTKGQKIEIDKLKQKEPNSVPEEQAIKQQQKIIEQEKKIEELTKSLKKEILEKVAKGSLLDATGSGLSNKIKEQQDLIAKQQKEIEKLKKSNKKAEVEHAVQALKQKVAAFNKDQQNKIQPPINHAAQPPIRGLQEIQNGEESLEKQNTSLKKQETANLNPRAATSQTEQAQQVPTASVATDSISDNDEILKAFREMLTKQEEFIKQKYAELQGKETNKGFTIDFGRYNDEDKKAIEEVLQKDYAELQKMQTEKHLEIAAKFPNSFKEIKLSDAPFEIKNDNGVVTCKLTSKEQGPMTVKDLGGKDITLTKSRNIEVPLNVEKDTGPVHLRLTVRGSDGKPPPASDPAYFTAHYDKAGKLVEMTTPQPVKFGDDPKSPGYFEKNGKIYTLPINKKQYEEMSKEVSKNKGKYQDLTKETKISQTDQKKAAIQEKIEEIKKRLTEGYNKETAITPTAKALAANSSRGRSNSVNKVPGL